MYPRCTGVCVAVGRARVDEELRLDVRLDFSIAPVFVELRFTPSTRSTLGLALGSASVGRFCHDVGALQVATGRARPGRR